MTILDQLIQDAIELRNEIEEKQRVYEKTREEIKLLSDTNYSGPYGTITWYSIQKEHFNPIDIKETINPKLIPEVVKEYVDEKAIKKFIESGEIDPKILELKIVDKATRTFRISS